MFGKEGGASGEKETLLDFILTNVEKLCEVLKATLV